MKRIALAAAVAALAAAAPAAARTPATIHLTGTQTYLHMVDTAPGGYSLGDQFIFGEVLKTKAGKRAGFDQISCRLAGRWPREADFCQATIFLAGGKIVAEGGTGGRSFSVPIVGGTGAYLGARGQIDVAPLRHGESLTIRLLG